MDFLTCHFSLIFFPFASLRHHVLSYNPSQKKKKKKIHPLAIPFLTAHGEEQALSDISAGRQGGRFFPVGWRLPPNIQNTPLPKNPPSQASSTKGADPVLGVSECPHPFLFLLHPVAWEWHKSLGNVHRQSVYSPVRPGLGLALISHLPRAAFQTNCHSDNPSSHIRSLFYSIYLRACHR